MANVNEDEDSVGAKEAKRMAFKLRRKFCLRLFARLNSAQLQSSRPSKIRALNQKSDDGRSDAKQLLCVVKTALFKGLSFFDGQTNERTKAGNWLPQSRV